MHRLALRLTRLALLAAGTSFLLGSCASGAQWNQFANTQAFIALSSVFGQLVTLAVRTNTTS